MECERALPATRPLSAWAPWGGGQPPLHGPQCGRPRSAFPAPQVTLSVFSPAMWGLSCGPQQGPRKACTGAPVASPRPPHGGQGTPHGPVVDAALSVQQWGLRPLPVGEQVPAHPITPSWSAASASITAIYSCRGNRHPYRFPRVLQAPRYAQLLRGGHRSPGTMDLRSPRRTSGTGQAPKCSATAGLGWAGCRCCRRSGPGPSVCHPPWVS